jgi:branched-chain amino acid transport system permease protein
MKVTAGIHDAWSGPLNESAASRERTERARPIWGIALAAALVGLAVLLVAMPLLVDDYVLSAILVPVLALALAGIGQNIVTGYAGQLSVGSAAFMSVGAFAAYDLYHYVPGTPLFVSFFFGGVVAAATGVFFGLPSLRIRGFYLVVSTLAAQFFVEWLFTKVGWFTGNSASGVITAPPLRFLGFDLSSPGGHYWLSLAFVAPLALVARNLVRGQIGRSWMAVRDMEVAAAVVGVRTRRAKLLAFAVGCFYCGIAGTLWAFAYLGTVEPHGLDLDRSFQVLFIVILGGLGSASGPFLGAAFVVAFPILLDRVASAVVGGSVDPGLLQNVDKMIFGSLVILLLVKQPAGMARLVQIGWIRARAAVHSRLPPGTPVHGA